MTKMAGFCQGVGPITSLQARHRHWRGPEVRPFWKSFGGQRKSCGMDSAGCSLG